MKKTVGIIIGSIFFLAGVAAMFKPVQAFLELGWLAGALLLGHGMERIWIMVSEKTVTLKKVLPRILETILGFAILGCTFIRLITDLVICYALSGCVILFGAYFALNGIRTSESRNQVIIKGIVGVLIAGLGFVLLNEPAGTVLTVAYSLATALALLGADIIMICLFGRKEAFKDE